MKSLLPKNATDFELALEDVLSSRLEGLPIPFRSMWNPWTCPAGLLPWLAHSLGVDRWPDTYTDKQKRETIAGSVDIYRRRGTLGAIKRVLVIEGFDVTVHENSAGPFTMSLELDDDGSGNRASHEEVESIVQAVQQVKNVRTHFVLIAINAAARTGLTVGVSAASHRVTSIRLDQWQDNAPEMEIRGGFSMQIRQTGSESGTLSQLAN